MACARPTSSARSSTPRAARRRRRREEAGLADARTTTRTSPRPEWRTSPTTSRTSNGAAQRSRSRPRRRSRRSSTSPRARRRSSRACSTSCPNGSGFVRMDPAGQSPEDVYVSPAQIRRCELRAGDEVERPGAAAAAQRAPSLAGPRRDRQRRRRRAARAAARVLRADPCLRHASASRRPRRSPTCPSARARASRSAARRAPGRRACCARSRARSPTVIQTWSFRSCSWARGPRRSPSGVPRRAGRCPAARSSGPPRAQAQAAELVVERAKRHAERGGHAAILIDSLDALPAAAQRRVFGAARATEEAGSVTVIAATGEPGDSWRWATTRISLEPGGSGGPSVSAERSGTLRADALGSWSLAPTACRRRAPRTARARARSARSRDRAGRSRSRW